ncbi:MAG: hypothetical protein R2715_19605 [Ilumatobacteraceae bacterium]
MVWIELLYWFNFVQAPALDDLERDPRDERTRNLLLTGIARRTLWWFRWAAFATFITGMLILLAADGYFNEQFGESTGLAISTGMFLGIVMVLNVWGVIWRAQKTVLADARGPPGQGRSGSEARRCSPGLRRLPPERGVLRRRSSSWCTRPTGRCSIRPHVGRQRVCGEGDDAADRRAGGELPRRGAVEVRTEPRAQPPVRRARRSEPGAGLVRPARTVPAPHRGRVPLTR